MALRVNPLQPELTVVSYIPYRYAVETLSFSFGKARAFFAEGADNSAGKRTWEPHAGREPKAEAQDGPSQLFCPAPLPKKQATPPNEKRHPFLAAADKTDVS